MSNLGKKASFFVNNISKLDINLPVIEIGSGEGHEAKLLADRGFSITTIDPQSSIKDSRINEIHQKFEDVDIQKLQIGHLIALFSLHFIEKEIVKEKLASLIDSTQIGSVHILADFLPIPPLYPNGNSIKFFLTDQVISELYKDWTTLSKSVEEVKTYDGRLQSARFIVLKK